MEFGGGRGGGPCGACKFLRRKCVKGCIFAPYFDSAQGTAHFAAVHKVFGASNASKLLMRIPVHKRLDAVVTLCYEALAWVRDPIYGCVAHIFSLQQQVVNLQAELAYVQARISTLHRLSDVPPFPCPPPTLQYSSSNHHLQYLSSNNDLQSGYMAMHFDHPLQHQHQHQHQTSLELSSFLNSLSYQQHQALAPEYRFFPGSSKIDSHRILKRIILYYG